MQRFLSIIIQFLVLLLLMPTSGTAQHEFEKWYHLDASSTFQTGIGSETWYKTSTDTKAQTIVVAILDSGVDIAHPDLQHNIWVNPNEIAGNQIDDDGNGYVDDIHGWNFIGGPDGSSVLNESLEVTRTYAAERDRWEGVNATTLKGKKKKEYEAFLERKELIEKKRQNAHLQIDQMLATSEIVIEALLAAKEELDGDSLDLTQLENSPDEDVQIAARIIKNVEEQGVTVESIDWLIELAIEQFEDQIAPNKEILDYTYNPDCNARAIVGDDYYDFENRYYGNNQVDGEFALHGTHVAGIVGAVRDNDLGMDGIADKVAIMCVKLIPDGDERDKDVANGIRYAVDNGALVINMSFGKGYSPEKYLVDDAMKYAAKHDVLLVLGAGNEGTNIDDEPKYPNDEYQKKPFFSPKRAKNLLSVGALSPELGENAIAEFSNYGKKDVDIFAPGVYIYATTPDSTYDYLSGTSMAAPVVSGVAVLLRSRYPELTAVQIKEIIMNSSRKLPARLVQPGTFDIVSPDELSVSSGMIDVIGAFKLAEETKGKAKLTKRVNKSNYVPGAGRT